MPRCIAMRIADTLWPAIGFSRPVTIREVHMSSAADFDFLCHDWKVHHRKLQTRLNNADDWLSFTGTSTTRPVMGGGGNVEDNVLDDPHGAYRAVALRSFDSLAGLWRIWWLDQRMPGEIGPPVVGRFDGGEGIFLGDDTWQGKAIKLRFLWSKDAGEGPRWQQAFSLDDGQTWEDNWVMDFRRRSHTK